MSGDGRWIALYSGGKDSYLALDAAERSGRSVERLVTVDAPPGSYVYHAPATAAAALAARAMGTAHDRLDLDGDPGRSSRSAAAREAAPLASYLEARLAEGPVAGLVSGVVASTYQHDLLVSLCDTHGLELYAPLWGRPGGEVLAALERRGVAADVVAVAAEGLDRSWLGRRLDASATAELLALATRRGVHPAGEGGEFETLVVDAPRFDAPIRYRARRVWDGTRGHLSLEQSWLADEARPG
ncbi:MAG: diphthine--ammonia ligase [Halobacteriales archaeon]